MFTRIAGWVLIALMWMALGLGMVIAVASIPY